MDVESSRSGRPRAASGRDGRRSEGIGESPMSKSHSTLKSFCSRVCHIKPLTRCQSFLSAKTAIGAGIAWAAAQAVEPHGRPYFAPIAVVSIVQPAISDSLSRALQRVIGVILGVAIALIVSLFLGASAWSIGIIVFAGLLLGRTFRLGSQGVSQVCITALLVFLLGRVTPGYGSERIVETGVGAVVAILVVLLSPSAPTLEVVLSEALAPLRHCSETLRSIGEGVGQVWTRDQALAWRQGARELMQEIDAARHSQEQHQLNARWNLRARDEQGVLSRSEEALQVGERIAAYARLIARALMDGSVDAQAMPRVSAVLLGTASATDTFAARFALGENAIQLRDLSEMVRCMDDAIEGVVSGLDELSGVAPASWLTIATVLTISHWILAELGEASRRHGNSTGELTGRNESKGATV